MAFKFLSPFTHDIGLYSRNENVSSKNEVLLIDALFFGFRGPTVRIGGNNKFLIISVMYTMNPMKQI